MSRSAVATTSVAAGRQNCANRMPAAKLPAAASMGAERKRSGRTGENAAPCAGTSAPSSDGAPRCFSSDARTARLIRPCRQAAR